MKYRSPAHTQMMTLCADVEGRRGTGAIRTLIAAKILDTLQVYTVSNWTTHQRREGLIEQYL